MTLILDIGGSLAGLVMFFFLGRLVDRAQIPAAADLQQGYFAFAVIGLGLLKIAQISASSFARKVRSEQMAGTLEAMLASPTPAAVVILAGSVYAILEATGLALLELAVAVALFGLNLRVSAWSVLTVLCLVCVASVLFSALGVLMAAFTIVFKQGVALVSPLLLVMSILGGVYFPVKILPSFLRFLGHLNPFGIVLDGLRAGLLRADADLSRLSQGTVVAGLAMPLALWVLELALRHARRGGTLDQY